MIISTKIFLRNVIIKSKERKLSRRSDKLTDNSLMILRTDAIGDYILFRNFIKVIRESKKFKDYHITLCGNISWKELAEKYDSQYIDEFIWVDNSKFLKRSEWVYTYKILEEIHSKGFGLLIDPNPLKTYQSEYIKEHSGAGKIIDDEPTELREFAKKFSSFIAREGSKNKNVSLEHFFQFYSNKKFVESLVETKTELKRTEIKAEILSESKNYIVLFPGAGSINRIWSPMRFAELCRNIRATYDSTIIICGDSQDSASAKDIIKKAEISGLEDLTGKTTLPQLVNLIANSALLVSNETCAVHIAASVGTKTICLSNGNHFGRFNPYPKSMADNIETIYPPEIAERMNDYENLIKEFAIRSSVDINEISAEQVFKAVVTQLDGTFSKSD